jgi:hypothetical protein
VLFLVAIGKSRTVTSDPGTGETGTAEDSAADGNSSTAGHAGH